MKPWRERDPQLAALFNPAFAGCILYSSVSRFQKSDRRGIPFPLLFLILPIVLSQTLRESLPSTTRTPFHLWISRAPQVRIGLAERVSNLAPITREALLFLLQRGKLHLEKARITRSTAIRGLSGFADDRSEIAELLDGARILGGMLARASDAENVFITLGITI